MNQSRQNFNSFSRYLFESVTDNRGKNNAQLLDIWMELKAGKTNANCEYQ